MKLKLLALAGIMTATMGLTACGSNTEEAADNLDDAQGEVQEAQDDLSEAAAEGDMEMAAEGDMAAVDASDDVVTEEEAPAAQ